MCTEKLVEELRIYNNNMKDVYIRAELSIGDKFITVVSSGVKVIYPTCNVTKIIIGKQAK